MPRTSNDTAQLALFESIKEATQAAVEDGLARGLKKLRKAADPASALSTYPQNMRIDQVAAFLNVSDDHIRDLIDEGHLEAHAINPGSKKQHLRVTRASVEQFLSTDARSFVASKKEAA